MPHRQDHACAIRLGHPGGPVERRGRKVRDYLDEELIRSTARYWGRFSGVRYAEPLEVLRDQDSDPLRLPAMADAGEAAEAGDAGDAGRAQGGDHVAA